jgi:hypothetical protein
MTNDNAEQQAIQLFQRNLIAHMQSNINNILPMLGKDISENATEKVKQILSRCSRSAIVRCFEILNNEEIIYWSKIYQEITSKKFMDIDNKLKPVMVSSIDRTVDEIMKIITE